MVRRFSAWITLAGFWMISTAVLAAPEAAPAKISAEAKQEILHRIESAARGYDLNKQEKYYIQPTYAPRHAMGVYRELLLFSDQPGVPEPLRKELLTTITAGVVSVIRDSGAGPVKKKNSALGVGFVKALPRYTKEPDPAHPETLRWSKRILEPVTSPGSVGKSLSVKALLLPRLKRGSSEYKLVLASLRREYDFVAKKWLKSAPAAYMPEAVRWEKGRWKTTDKRSHLSSQAALLSGLVETEVALAKLGPSTASWRKQVQRHIRNQLAGLVKRHYDRASHSFVNLYQPGKKGRGDRVSLVEMDELIEALTVVLEHQPRNSPAWKQAKQMGREQIRFLLRVGKWDGDLPRGYLVKKGIPIRAILQTVEEPLAIATILGGAGQFGVKGEDDALKQVKESLEANFWSSEAKIYRSAVGFTRSAYDGRLFGTAMRFFRRGGGTEAMGRAEGLIEGVWKKAGLLQCEPPGSGEPLTKQQWLEQRGPAFIDEIASLPKGEQALRINAFVREMVDQDSDTVPGCRYGAGDFGGAPVPVVQTSVTTPYPPKADDKEGDVGKEEKGSEEKGIEEGKK